MLEALAISVLGSFFYDNVEFFKTVKNKEKVDTNGNGIIKIETQTFLLYHYNMIR